MAFLDEHAREREWAYNRREGARQQLQEQLRGSTASMSETVQAARDLIRHAEYATTLANERRMVAEVQASEARTLVAAQPVSAPSPTSNADAAIMGLFDGYIAERQPSASTVRSWRPIMAHLIRTLGHDDGSRVTPVDMIRWKNVLLSETDAEGAVSRSARTVADVYLASVKVVFGWAVDNLRIPSNPAASVKVRVPKTAKLREPGFTDAEALTILRAAMVPPTSNLAPANALARRWVPWLCAYTGARVNEIGQLRGQDVRQTDGVWTIRITPEAGTTKNNAARIVPIHEHLIAQGFLDVAKANGAGHLFFDPSQQRKPGVESRQYKKVGERLAAWVRLDLGITDKEVMPNHGWRHMFKTNARRCRMDHAAMDRLQGHAAKTEGDKYGYFPMETLAAEIGKLPRFSI